MGDVCALRSVTLSPQGGGGVRVTKDNQFLLGLFAVAQVVPVARVAVVHVVPVVPVALAAAVPVSRVAVVQVVPVVPVARVAAVPVSRVAVVQVVPVGRIAASFSRIVFLAFFVRLDKKWRPALNDLFIWIWAPLSWCAVAQLE